MPRSRIRPQEPFIVKLPQFAPAMAWMDAHDVPRRSIADAFRTTPAYVSVLIHRTKTRVQGNPAPRFESLPFESILSRRLTVQESEPVRIRPEAFELNELQARMEEIVYRNRKNYTFLQAAAELNQLRPYLGDPRNESLSRLLAQLHCHKAWFFTHAGWSRSSIQEANEAYLCAVDLYRRTNSSAELQLIADAALIASNSHLNRSEPFQAQRALRVAAAARERQAAYLNEEYYRQSAVANLQASNDQEARRALAKAKTVMREHGHAENDVSVLLSTRRQANFLAPVNWDGKGGALEVLNSVIRQFPVHSNEFNIAVSWAAACGFSVDSPSANLKAQELVEHHCTNASRFGHRATVVNLLHLVPQLPKALRADFVRFAVHQNAFGEL